MRQRTLAHVSDLHLGAGADAQRAALELARALDDFAVDHVVVTGDVTHRGREAELAAFESAFSGLRGGGRLTVVPGNHDRLGDDVARKLMPGARVQVAEAAGLYLVRVDSTAPHNRGLLASHGLIGDDDLDAIDHAVAEAPLHALVVVLLHHHPVRLPEEHFSERLSSWLGWPFAAELRNGPALLARLRGRADLLLHGHRHVPRAFVFFADESRPLGVYNGGSSPELGRFRLFTHRGGLLCGRPEWQAFGRPKRGVARPHHADDDIHVGELVLA